MTSKMTEGEIAELIAIMDEIDGRFGEKNMRRPDNNSRYKSAYIQFIVFIKKVKPPVGASFQSLEDLAFALAKYSTVLFKEDDDTIALVQEAFVSGDIEFFVEMESTDV